MRAATYCVCIVTLLTEGVSAQTPSVREATCAFSAEMPQVALDGDDVFWVRQNGSVAEQYLTKRMAFVTGAPGDRQRLGPFTFREPIQDYAGIPPRIVAGIESARGVATVQVIRFGTARSPFGALFDLSAKGLLGQLVRVAVLKDDSLAVWISGQPPTIYSADRVLKVLGGAHILSIQDGRFVLSDGTVEDGVLERLEGDPIVLAGISRGQGNSRAELKLYPPRTTESLPSFKYSFANEVGAVRCVKQIEGHAFLLENGKLYRTNRDGDSLDDWIDDNVELLARSDVAFAYLKKDGSIWYELGAFAQRPKRSMFPKDITDVVAIWAASQDGTYTDADLPYDNGLWLRRRDGSVWRWNGSSPTMDNSDAERPQIVEVERWRGSQQILSRGPNTIALLPQAALEAWVPRGGSIITEQAHAGYFLAVGEVGPGSIRVLDPITRVPATTLMEGLELTRNMAWLTDNQRGKSIRLVPATPTGKAVLRIPTYQAGDRVSLKVRSLDCQDGQTPPACKEAAYTPAHYGSLVEASADPSTLPSQAISLLARDDPNSSSDQKPGLVVVVYRTPENFERKIANPPAGAEGCVDKHVFPDCGQSYRDVYLEITYSSGGLVQTFLEPLTISRPLDPCGREIDLLSLTPIGKVLEMARSGDNAPYVGESLGEERGRFTGFFIATDRVKNAFEAFREGYQASYQEEMEAAQAACDLKRSARVIYAYMIAVQPLGFSAQANQRFGQLMKAAGLDDLLVGMTFVEIPKKEDVGLDLESRVKEVTDGQLSVLKNEVDRLQSDSKRLGNVIEEWTAQDKRKPGSMGEHLKRAKAWKESIDDQLRKGAWLFNILKVGEKILGKLSSALMAYEWSQAVTKFFVYSLTSTDSYDTEMRAFVARMGADFREQANHMGYSEAQGAEGARLLVEYFQAMGMVNASSR